MSNSKELKKEKNELKELLSKKISEVNDKDNLNEIIKILNDLNEKLNDKDSVIEKILGDIWVKLAPSAKTKIIRIMNDVLDKYDQVKHGEPTYSDAEKTMIRDAFNKINGICDKSFIEKMLSVFGIGS